MPTQTPAITPPPRRIVRQPALDPWPEIPFLAWTETRETLHRWTQILGKVRLALAPHRNHWWHVPLYVTCRGLTTSMMPIDRDRELEMELDFVASELRVASSDGDERRLPLRPESVAALYARVMRALRELGVDVAIWPTPVEVVDRVPLDRDHAHASYDADAARRFWRALTCVQPVMERFQSRFLGKVSPIHFFWGSFDLASTRFSGRGAPPHPGAPNVARFVMREAYSRELSSIGFWPGGGGYDAPAFYSYAYPQPEGYASARVAPAAAFYHPAMGEYVLPYDAVRTASDPVETLLAFFQSTYDAAAECGRWERAALERAECLGAR